MLGPNYRHSSCIYTYPASACLSDGAVSAFTSGTTGVPQYNWSGNGFNTDATVLPNIPSGWYYFTVSDNVCSASDSAFVPQNAPPIAVMTPSVITGCSPLTVTFQNTSQNTNAYAWSFGDGSPGVNTTNLSSVTHTFQDDAVITLIAFNGSCSDTTTVPVSVYVCGCMDPEGTNYNPLAEVSDNSCVYPIPEAEAPNVITPNGDGLNDFFELRVKNTVEIEIIINNRWGNLIYKGKGPVIKWDGKDSGKMVAEGTYFYQYTAIGVDGSTVSGQGFVQVFK
jgi:gliding motility-associated-like protein